MVALCLQDGIWTEMVHISRADITEMVKELAGDVKISPIYPTPQADLISDVFGD